MHVETALKEQFHCGMDFELIMKVLNNSQRANK